MSEIKNLRPERLWRNFDALTQVPRPSGHLEKVQKFLLDFAASIGVEAFQDPAGNIVMRKPATPGMEGKKTVTLQAHMDMVPQKSPESTHNFETDPIQTYIDGDWVKAKGTTLGSDDGIGVAAIMAVFEDNELKHGPIEALITRDEETGMYGANELPAGELKGDILLNLDSETWGKFVIGSAGGVNICAELDYKDSDTDPDDAAVKVTLKGLRGGHSGLEIHEGRANANKLMVRFVREAISKCEARLASWHGGNMRNAIPFKAEVVLTLPKDNVKALEEMVADWKDEFVAEYKGIENGIEFFVETVDTPAKEVPQDIQDNLVDALYACHDGVLRMEPSMPHLVETSSNLAIVNIEEGKAEFKILARSSNEEFKSYVTTMLESCFNMAGMKVTCSGSYQGWTPNTESEILTQLKKVYKSLFNEDAVQEADHAGLECSVILSKYPHMDVVSLGPTLRSPHTTNERCLIPTVEPFYKLISTVLQEIADK